MKPAVLFRAAARCWERAGHFDRAAERYARADAWVAAGRCWAQASRPVDAAAAYARAGEPIREARQWLASPWPERARRPYRQVLETGLSTAAEVEALLGLGEIELALERAFTVEPENRQSVEALCSLARIAAARGRPDLAARAWGQAMGWSPAGALEVFENWERSASWNRSLGWERRPPSETSGWPSRSFRDVRLELVWEEKLGAMMFGNRALAWNPDGKRIAATTWEQNVLLGDLSGVRHPSSSLGANSVGFIPESDWVLVGCNDGQVFRGGMQDFLEEVEVLQMSDYVTETLFSPQGDRVAVLGGNSSEANLRIWSWDFLGPSVLLWDQYAQQEEKTIPVCAWSPSGEILAWCPACPRKEETVPVFNDLYMMQDEKARRIPAAHNDWVTNISFCPAGDYWVTISFDQTLVIRSLQTGARVAPPWRFAHFPLSASFHPRAALLAIGEATDRSAERRDRPGRLHLFRFIQSEPPSLEVLQESSFETAVMALAFSPDGEHLLMSTNDRLSLFRVHLI